MSESVTKTGIVTAINEEVKQSKPPKTGTYKVYNLFVDGQRYGLGYKRKLVDDAGVTLGDTVKITVVKTGDFWNVDSLEKVAPQTTNVATTTPDIPRTSSTTGAETPPRTNGANGVQQQIVRQSALKIALDMVVPFATDARRKQVLPLEQQLGKIVAFADHFVQYVETGKLELASVEDARKLAEEGVEA